MSVCRGDAVTLAAPEGFETYAWTPAAAVSDPQARVVTDVVFRDAVYTVTYELAAGDNLVRNGGFEEGNVGFSSEYRHVPGGTFEQGSYAILTDPQTFNRDFANCADPSGGRSNMYVADGATRRGAEAWCQAVSVEPGRRYAFALSVASLVSASPPRLSFSIEGARVGSANLPPSTCAWQRFFTIWTAPAGATEVELCIVNDNETPDGNDFALDEVSLRPLDPSGPRTLTFAVEVSRPARATLDTFLCVGERYRANGLDLAAGESGVASLRTREGCDSTLTVNTALAPPIITRAFDTTSCRGATVRFEGLDLVRDTVITRRGTSDRGCDSTYVFTLRFFDRTALRPLVSPPSCPGDADASIALAITAGVPPYAYEWSDGSAGAVLAGVSAGDYRVRVRDADGCRAEREVEVVDPPPLRITELTPTPAACANEPSGGVAYAATGGTGEQTAAVTDTAGRRRDPERLPGGDYVLRVTDERGCFAERPFTVTAPPPVTLALSGDTSVTLGQEARALLTVTGDGVRVRWDYGLAPLDSLVDGNRVTFVPTGSGRLRAVGTDANGCDEETSLEIEVRKGRRAYFPSAFSPNGDEVNDVFGPAPSGAIARVIELRVFNRWGGLVFAAANCGVREAGCSWGGRSGGDLLPLEPGVFVYVAELALIDGRTVVDAGEVTLVR